MSERPDAASGGPAPGAGPPPPPAPGPPRRARAREAVAALILLVCSSLLAAGVAEAFFRIRGTGEPARWYLTRDEASARNVETARYEPTPRLPLRIAPARFAARKAPGARRVFLLGDSTVYGYPYGPKGTPARALELLLGASAPGRVEVINAGFLGADSSRALALLSEILDFDPDAVVVYVGHNEFLRYDQAHQFDVHFDFNPRVPESLSVRAFVGLHRSALWRWACGTDLGVKARAWWLERRTGLRTGRSGLVEGALREATFRNHRENLVDMARMCRERSVRLVLCTVAGNLRSQPPLLRRHGDAGAAEAAARAPLTEAEASVSAGRWDAALEATRAARTRDPLDPWPDWVAAQALLGAGRTPEAAAAFESALEEDALRHRAFARISETVREVAGAEGATIADILARFEAASPGGLVGEELIVDHVHPNLSGMVLLAREIAAALERAGALGASSNTPGNAPGTSPGTATGVLSPALSDDEIVRRLGVDRAGQRDAMLRLAVSAAGQSNPRRAASLFQIAATLYEAGDPDAALGPPFFRGVAALLQDDTPRGRELLAQVRAADPAWYDTMTRRFAQLRIAERAGI